MSLKAHVAKEVCEEMAIRVKTEADEDEADEADEADATDDATPVAGPSLDSLIAFEPKGEEASTNLSPAQSSHEGGTDEEVDDEVLVDGEIHSRSRFVQDFQDERNANIAANNALLKEMFGDDPVSPCPSCAPVYELMAPKVVLAQKEALAKKAAAASKRRDTVAQKKHHAATVVPRRSARSKEAGTGSSEADATEPPAEGHAGDGAQPPPKPNVKPRPKPTRKPKVDNALVSNPLAI
jgi:hypothetical protein